MPYVVEQSDSQCANSGILRSGWLVSTSGLASRTGVEAYAPAYEATFWVDGALDETVLCGWNERKRAYAASCAVVGQKGAYGKLAELNREFQAAFESEIVGRLKQGCGRNFEGEQRIKLAEFIENGTGYELLAWVVGGNYVRILAMLSSEAGMDVLIDSWKKALPDVSWSDSVWVQSVMPADCPVKIDELLEPVVSCGVQLNSVDSIEAGGEHADFNHVTVLLHESVDMLAPCEGKIIVDATLGGGGHSELLLERGATVFGIDQDPEARQAASVRLARFGKRFRALAGNFREIVSLLAEQGFSQVDGILADLGISSHQVDTAERGFSFRENGPLDMRMNPGIRRSAADLVNTLGETELARIIWEYGEERASRAIVRAIAKARAEKPFRTTLELADTVASVLPRKGKQHPATRTFQALRIAVNDELGSLDDLLEASIPLLNTGGRMAVITFHSLEDRRVKQFFDLHSRPEIDRKEWPAARPNPDYCYNLLVRRPLIAGEQELSSNTRSRSAKLRGVEKIQSLL